MIPAAYVVEWLKLRRSRVPRVTAAALLVLPAVMAALFMAMADRDRGDAMSLKAQALVTRDGWAGYLDALTQIYASAGLLGMGVVVAWCFGREYADRTVASLFGSATPRESVAAAKLAVLAVWFTGVSLALFPAALPPRGARLAVYKPRGLTAAATPRRSLAVRTRANQPLVDHLRHNLRRERTAHGEVRADRAALARAARRGSSIARHLRRGEVVT